eukprot:scaffold1953_cov19-Tisochrysis_lutea.AAC.1
MASLPDIKKDTAPANSALSLGLRGAVLGGSWGRPRPLRLCNGYWGGCPMSVLLCCGCWGHHEPRLLSNGCGRITVP